MDNPPVDLLEKWKWTENNLPTIQQNKILSIKENKNSNTEIVLLSLTPVNAPVTITFWTTRK